MSWRTLALSLFWSLTLLGAHACPAHADAPPRVALVMKSVANEFFRAMEQDARAHQEAHRGQYVLLPNGTRDDTDTAGQIRLVQQMVAQDIDALVIAPMDSKALVPALQAAIAKGIIVINIDNRLDAQALAEKHVSIPYVGPDNRAGARLAGEYVARQLKPGDTVGIIEGVSTTSNAQQRTLGFRDAMQAAAIPVVALQSGEWEIQKGNSVAAAMLRAQPGLDALLCGNDNMALGAIAAVKTAGKTGAVKVVGYDNIPAVKPLLHEDRLLATVDQFPGRQAVDGIELALKALKEKIPQNNLPAVTTTQVLLVTH